MSSAPPDSDLTPEPPILEEDSPVLGEDSTDLKEDSTDLKEDSPISTEDSPTLEGDLPILKENSTILKEDLEVVAEQAPLRPRLSTMDQVSFITIKGKDSKIFKDTPNTRVITLDEPTPVLSLFLEYIYTLRLPVPPEDCYDWDQNSWELGLLQLYCFADRHQIPDVRRAVIDALYDFFATDEEFLPTYEAVSTVRSTCDSDSPLYRLIIDIYACFWTEKYDLDYEDRLEARTAVPVTFFVDIGLRTKELYELPGSEDGTMPEKHHYHGGDRQQKAENAEDLKVAQVNQQLAAEVRNELPKIMKRVYGALENKHGRAKQMRKRRLLSWNVIKALQKDFTDEDLQRIFPIPDWALPEA